MGRDPKCFMRGEASFSTLGETAVEVNKTEAKYRQYNCLIAQSENVTEY